MCLKQDVGLVKDPVLTESEVMHVHVLGLCRDLSVLVMLAGMTHCITPCNPSNTFTCTQGFLKLKGGT